MVKCLTESLHRVESGCGSWLCVTHLSCPCFAPSHHSNPLFLVLIQEDFIRGALTQLEAERDEARQQLEEERRLYMAARQQAFRLEQQHLNYKPVHKNDHEHNQSQAQHSQEHSG